MKELFGIPVITTETAGDSIYLLPKVMVSVHIPPQGYTSGQIQAAEMEALVEAYISAARRGEVGVVRNVER